MIAFHPRGFDSPVAPRGYAWWYVDALSDDGRHGLTLIAFIGSVFSPWYAWRRRQGGGDPLDHCTMHVALYGDHKRWTMTERGRTALSRDAAHLAIGPSSLEWDGTSLVARIAETGCPIPRRVAGTIRLHPPALSVHEVDLAGNGRHRWSPIAPRARVEVDLRQPASRWAGTAYFDTNSGDEPLEDAFREWDWCRAPLQDGVAVLYDRVLRDGTRLATALRYAADGSCQPFAAPPRVRLQDTLWRLPRWTHADPGHPAYVAQTLTDAPFYARSIVQGLLCGDPVTAIHESLSLERFRAPWVQAMLPFKAPRRG